MTDQSLICSFERIGETQVVCGWWTTAHYKTKLDCHSLNNNPASVIILGSKARKLEAKLAAQTLSLKKINHSRMKPI